MTGDEYRVSVHDQSWVTGDAVILTFVRNK